MEKHGIAFGKPSIDVDKLRGFKESVVVACDINSKKRSPWESPDYSESQIYSKFIDSHDKHLSKAFLESESTEDKITIIHQMNDGRLIDFAKRLLASENENCDPVVQMNYQEFEAKRLLSDYDVPWRTLNDARKSTFGRKMLNKHHNCADFEAQNFRHSISEKDFYDKDHLGAMSS